MASYSLHHIPETISNAIHDLLTGQDRARIVDASKEAARLLRVFPDCGMSRDEIAQGIVTESRRTASVNLYLNRSVV